MNDTNKERAAFEAWYASQPDATAEPERSYELDEAGMNDLTKDCIWEGWKARAAKAPAAPGFQQALDIRTAQGWKLGGDKVPVLYTDSINGQQVCRDDVWLCATAAFAVPPAAEPVAEVKELFIPATGATAKAAHLMDTSLPGGTMLYTAPPAPTEQWRDIETAPRDGTEVLLWREDCGQFIGRYTSCDAFPLTQDEIDATDEETLFAKDWFTQWPQALRLEGSEVPTRWRHLPDDPAPPQGAAKGDGNG